MQAFLNNTGVGSLHLVLVGYLFIFFWNLLGDSLMEENIIMRNRS